MRLSPHHVIEQSSQPLSQPVLQDNGHKLVHGRAIEVLEREIRGEGWDTMEAIYERTNLNNSEGWVSGRKWAQHTKQIQITENGLTCRCTSGTSTYEEGRSSACKLALAAAVPSPAFP